MRVLVESGWVYTFCCLPLPSPPPPLSPAPTSQVHFYYLLYASRTVECNVRKARKNIKTCYAEIKEKKLAEIRNSVPNTLKWNFLHNFLVGSTSILEFALAQGNLLFWNQARYILTQDTAL